MGNCLACFKLTSKRNDIDPVSNSIKVDDPMINQQKIGQIETRGRKEKGN